MLVDACRNVQLSCYDGQYRTLPLFSSMSLVKSFSSSSFFLFLFLTELLGKLMMKVRQSCLKENLTGLVFPLMTNVRSDLQQEHLENMFLSLLAA